mgnify:CR=1 FL=1
MLVHDRGMATTLVWKEDYIQKGDEYKVLSVDAYMDSPHSMKERDDGPSYLNDDDELDDDIPFELVSTPKTNVVSLDTVRKPVEVPDMVAKLRYARLYHTTTGKSVGCREQLRADL